MKLRYMIECALRDRVRDPHYEPIGVWVQGPGPGLDLVIEFLPGNADAEEAAQWVINRLVENDVKTLQDDFPDYHQSTMSPYHGMRSSPAETEEYGSTVSCARAILAKIQSGDIS